MKHSSTGDIQTRKVAILAADGVNEDNIQAIKDALTAAGAIGEVIAPKLGFITGVDDTPVAVAKTFMNTASVFYDAVYVPGGTNSVATLEADADAVHFLNEAFKHCKAIAFDTNAIQFVKATYFGRKLPEDNSDESVMMEGVIMGDDITKLSEQFLTAIAQHRFWEREKARKVPA